VKIKQRQVVGIVGILISIVACYLVFKEIDIQAVWDTAKQVPPLYLLVICLCYLTTPLLRAYRWKLSLPNHQKYLNGVVIGFAGNNVLPARGGELVRMEYFFRFNPNQSRVTIISSIIANKLLDGLALIVLLLVAINILEIGKLLWIGTIVATVSFFLCVSFGIILGIRIFGTNIKNWLSPFSNLLAKKTLVFTESIYEAIAFLKFDKNTLLVLSTSFAIWLMEGGMFIICLYAFLPESNVFWLGIFTLAIVNFGIILPSSPGYLGVFQAMTLLALRPFNIPETVALSVGLIVNFFQFVPITIWGIFVIWDWRLAFKN